ncbi:MAG: hypothetical protein R2854_31375 [Caldilineaceae bacterium]
MTVTCAAPWTRWARFGSNCARWCGWNSRLCRPLIGRDELVAQGDAALADDRSVSLTGAGGGQERLPPPWPTTTPAVFWYTIRPNSSMTS